MQKMRLENVFCMTAGQDLAKSNLSLSILPWLIYTRNDGRRNALESMSDESIATHQGISTFDCYNVDRRRGLV